jgi:hypothetical protein
LIRRGQRQVGQPIRIDREAMSRVGRHDHKALFQVAEQGHLAHDTQNPLVIDVPAFSLERMGHASIAIARKFEDDPLDLIA